MFVFTAESQRLSLVVLVVAEILCGCPALRLVTLTVVVAQAIAAPLALALAAVGSLTITSRKTVTYSATRELYNAGFSVFSDRRLLLDSFRREFISEENRGLFIFMVVRHLNFTRRMI
jgi:hypothetical protein